MQGATFLPMLLLGPILVATTANVLRRFVPEPWSTWLESTAQVATGVAAAVILVAVAGAWWAQRTRSLRPPPSDG